MNTRLIACYLAGEVDNDEEEKIKNWLNADAENEELMAEFIRIWQASDEKVEMFQKYFDPEEDWDELRNRILQEEVKDQAPNQSDLQFKNNYSDNNRFAQFLRIAAIIVVAALLGVFSYEQFYQQPEKGEPSLREISMDKGQRGNVTLSDGTEVTLNASSTIVMPDVFKSDKREITLKGQAYFDVTSNLDRPFIINTDQAVIEILGTSFDVRSYPDEKSIQVVVKEGEVSLTSRSDCLQKDTILNAGEMGQLFVSENRIEKNRIDDYELFLSWRDGFLKFKDARMERVADELERKYDIEIRFEDQQLKDLRLTAELKSRTIQHNLDVISASLNLKYKMDQQVVTFAQKK